MKYMHLENQLSYEIVLKRRRCSDQGGDFIPLNLSTATPENRRLSMKSRKSPAFGQNFDLKVKSRESISEGYCYITSRR